MNLRGWKENCGVVCFKKNMIWFEYDGMGMID